MKFLLAGLLMAIAAGAVWTGACYDPNKPAPCDPHCTDPAMVAHDAGSDRG